MLYTHTFRTCGLKISGLQCSQVGLVVSKCFFSGLKMSGLVFSYMYIYIPLTSGLKISGVVLLRSFLITIVSCLDRPTMDVRAASLRLQKGLRPPEEDFLCGHHVMLGARRSDPHWVCYKCRFIPKKEVPNMYKCQTFIVKYGRFKSLEHHYQGYPIEQCEVCMACTEKTRDSWKAAKGKSYQGVY